MSATPPAEAPQVRVIAMPADANPAGDIFGGWLMAHMDQAGASVALRRARGRVATVAVEAMTFHLPVRVSDEVSLYGRLLGVGRSSIHVHVQPTVVGWPGGPLAGAGPASYVIGTATQRAKPGRAPNPAYQAASAGKGGMPSTRTSSPNQRRA